MPTVGNRKFPYTKEGKEEAKEASKKTGKKVKMQTSDGYTFKKK